MNRRILKLLHLWLSVPLGVIIVLMCLSGAILLFERDFGHIGQAEVNCEGTQPVPIDSILYSATKYLNGENIIVGLIIYPDSHHAYKIMLANPPMAAIWVNQYTGEVIGRYERAKIFKVASAAHRRLFGKSKADGGYGAKAGKLIIGITTIGFSLILLSGLIIWWPKKAHWHGSFRIDTSHGAYKFWHDIHCVGGVVSSLVLMTCIFTGLTWSFGWYKNSLYFALGCEVAKSSIHNIPAENFKAWDYAYHTINSGNSDKEIRLYQGEVDVAIGCYGNQQALDTYRFDNATGQIICIEKYKDKTRSNNIKGWVYTLHVGAWMGWITRILYLLCVLIGALLPITGYYFWIKRLCRKKS